MFCNICEGYEWGEVDGSHPNRCRNCKSVERQRALKIVLDSLGLPKPGASILHCAPEMCLAQWFDAVSPEGYDPVDIAPFHYAHVSARQFDLTQDLETLPSDHYDLIVHLHVLEHLKVNIAYVLHHFHRALKPDGVHVFAVSIKAGQYDDEYLGPLSREAAAQRFGQAGRFRIFGSRDVGRNLGKMIRMPATYSLYDYADASEIDQANIPDVFRTGINGSSIFVTRKTDYLLWPEKVVSETSLHADSGSMDETMEGSFKEEPFY
jgi:SAM-dependent methyltransferase